MQDKLTVLVFRENDRSRTFQIPFRWLTRLGLSLGVFTLITLIALFLAVRFYRVSLFASPSRVQELEFELGGLQQAYDELLQKNKELVQMGPAPVAEPQAEPTSAPPAPTSSPSVAEGEAPPPLLFSALPASSRDAAVPNPANLAVQLEQVRVSWKGNLLNLAFNIQYTATDRGTQQGRIVVLARGRSTLLAYPEGVLNTVGAESLIDPSRGEFFSVSRFREVKASFGPASDRKDLQDLQILLFDTNGGLLLVQRIAAEATSP